MDIPADATLMVRGTLKNMVEKQTPDGIKHYAILETRNPFGDREAFFIKLNDGVTPVDLQVGEAYAIPVLHFVGDNRRLFLRTHPELKPERLVA